jgi:hypothetical protein
MDSVHPDPFHGECHVFDARPATGDRIADDDGGGGDWPAEDCRTGQNHCAEALGLVAREVQEGPREARGGFEMRHMTDAAQGVELGVRDGRSSMLTDR